MDGEIFVQIGVIVIALLGSIITYIIIPFIKSKLDEEQQKKLEFWVGIAVTAAEQIFMEPEQGEQKKQYVLTVLRDMGIDITMEQLEILIEAAVYELNKDKGK